MLKSNNTLTKVFWSSEIQQYWNNIYCFPLSLSLIPANVHNTQFECALATIIKPAVYLLRAIPYFII